MPRRTKRRRARRKGKRLTGIEYAMHVRRQLPLLIVCFGAMSAILSYMTFETEDGLQIVLRIAAVASGIMMIHFALALRRVLLLVSKAPSVERLRQLSPSTFEHFICSQFKRRGYSHARVLGGAGDRGVDIVTWKNGSKIAVQCKRYASGRKVTSPELQTFVGALKIAGADHGIFVTTSQFTGEATRIAREQKIQLMDEAFLTKWLRFDDQGTAKTPAGEPSM